MQKNNINNQKLRIIFAGTPEISKIILQNLLDNNFKIDLVLTQPDRPKGRGKKITASVVKELAVSNNIEVYQPLSFKNNLEAIEKIKGYKPDIIIVVAYGLILPTELLKIPPLGCINIHVSLLPKWRGASPIQHAILSGDTKTGVTIMKMDCGLDTGDILLQKSVDIENKETSLTLHKKLTQLGAEMIIKYLHEYGEIKPIKQNSTIASYAPKIEKSDAKISWNESALQIERKIRALNPAPVAFTTLNNTTLVKIWEAEAISHITKMVAGTIIDTQNNRLLIACGGGTILSIGEIQIAGKNKQNVAEFLRGQQNLLKQRFD